MYKKVFAVLLLLVFTSCPAIVSQDQTSIIARIGAETKNKLKQAKELVLKLATKQNALAAKDTLVEQAKEIAGKLASGAQKIKKLATKQNALAAKDALVGHTKEIAGKLASGAQKIKKGICRQADSMYEAIAISDLDTVKKLLAEHKFSKQKRDLFIGEAEERVKVLRLSSLKPLQNLPDIAKISAGIIFLNYFMLTPSNDWNNNNTLIDNIFENTNNILAKHGKPTFGNRTYTWEDLGYKFNFNAMLKTLGYLTIFGGVSTVTAYLIAKGIYLAGGSEKLAAACEIRDLLQNI